MDYRNIIKILLLINLTLATIFLFDVVVAYLYNEDYIHFLLYDIIFFIANLIVWLSFKNHRLSLNIRGSIMSVNILWLLFGLVGAIPLYAYTDISFASAFFEAISGFTTTGATIYTDIESLPHIVLFHRSLMHWLGGMGMIVLSVGLLSMINPTGSLSLFKAEATGVQLEKLTPKIRDTALILWGIYSFLTLVDMLLLKFFGMSWFDALNHAFSTISTGGFSTKNASLGYYNNSNGIIWTTTIFMILSGINFLAHLRFFHGDLTGYKNEEVKWYLIIFLALGTVLTIVHAQLDYSSFYDSAKHSFFSIASILTTTGFATVDYSLWSHLAIATIFIAMFIGGNAGSTAGGIKVIRLVIIFKALFSEFKQIIHPHTIVSVFVDKTKQSDRVMRSISGFFILYMITILLVMLYIYVQGFDIMTAISGALATVGNIGPGFSQVGPAENFSFFSDIDKIVLSIAMIIGRLECYTVYILFSLAFWRRF
ncbi:Potassium uptake protein TrkH [hydrothermal vent metagenome]|uniref:Potassium uptake protein TrkH n=1 Tax=hydrothermal vent metagenome TaxID=652676 RepID=A0A1W1CDQ6_9ZZZZ